MAGKRDWEVNHNTRGKKTYYMSVSPRGVKTVKIETYVPRVACGRSRPLARHIWIVFTNGVRQGYKSKFCYVISLNWAGVLLRRQPKNTK